MLGATFRVHRARCPAPVKSYGKSGLTRLARGLTCAVRNGPSLELLTVAKAGHHRRITTGDGTPADATIPGPYDDRGTVFRGPY